MHGTKKLVKLLQYKHLIANCMFVFFSIFTINIAWGNGNPIQNTPNDSYKDLTQTISLPTNVNKTIILNKNHGLNESQDIPNFSEDKLLANPALLKRAMESTLIQKNIAQIQLILPIYQKITEVEPTLIDYANALIAHSNGEHEKAIKHYRAVLAKNPQLSAVRFDLAIALYQDKQTGLALLQFKKLRSDELPKSVRASVEQAINAIEKQANWQINLIGYYKSEDNINNAPSKNEITFANGTLSLPKPEKAHGVHMDVNISKRFYPTPNNISHLSNKLYSKVSIQLNNDTYWDNHDYDDLIGRISTGIGYHNKTLISEFEPFIQKRLYSGNSYSKALGAKTTLNYQVNPKLSLVNVNEVSKETFDKRQHLDGTRIFTGLSAIYQTSPKQYFFTGFNHFDSEAKDLEDSYKIQGLSIGWGREWQQGISSKITITTNKRQHEGVDFFNIQREDKKHMANIMLWKRELQYWGLTPKLVLSWDETSSNHFYYDNQKNKNIKLEFSKEF